MTYTYGAAAGGGVDSNGHVVGKDAPVRIKNEKRSIQRSANDRWALVWKREYLLEIHYDIANIYGFRNLWGMCHNLGVMQVL